MIKTNLFVLVLCFLLLACNTTVDNKFFSCKSCSELKGLKLENIQDNIFEFTLNYPVGSGLDMASYKPYFSLNWKLEVKSDSIFVVNYLGRNLLWVFNHSNNFYTTFKDDHYPLIGSKIDSVFQHKNRKMYTCRLTGLWKQNSDAFMGTSLVLFMSSLGVEGMYISKFEEENFNSEYKEIIFYPIGNIFYKALEDSTKIIN